MLTGQEQEDFLDKEEARLLQKLENHNKEIQRIEKELAEVKAKNRAKVTIYNYITT